MKTAVLLPTTEAAIWARVTHPNGELTPAVARAILQLEFSSNDQERMHELSQKAQEGTLTPEEQVEIDNFERVGNMSLIVHWCSRVNSLGVRWPFLAPSFSTAFTPRVLPEARSHSSVS